MTNPLKAGDRVVLAEFGVVEDAAYDDNRILVRWDLSRYIVAVDAERLTLVDVTHPFVVIGTLTLAGEFIQGFEGDPMQSGIPDLLASIEKAKAIVTTLAIAPHPYPIMQLAERALVAAYGEPGPEPTNLESKFGRDAIAAIRVMIDWHKRVEAHATKPA